ncbi:MAG: class I SAM-dependent methyltransferase [Anaeromyxobacteraceae bacterium]
MIEETTASLDRLELEAVPRCPVCASPKRLPLYEGLRDTLFGAPGLWALVRCAGCGAAYLDPRPTEKTIAAAYRSYYTHEEVPSFAPPPESSTLVGKLKAALRRGYLVERYGFPLDSGLPVARWLVPLVFPRHRVAFDWSVRNLELPRVGARLLDVGCGSGAFLTQAASLGWQAEGQEVDCAASVQARARGFKITEGPLESGAFPVGSFDAITMAHVVEHLHRPGETLARARQLLTPGGRLWMATPNLESPLHRRMGSSWRGLEPPRHVVLFTRRSLTRLLKESGFTRLRWVTPYPSTRWMHRAGVAAAGRGPACSERELVMLEAEALLVRSRGEELAVVAEKSP